MKMKLIVFLAVINVFATCSSKKKTSKSKAEKYLETKEVIVDEKFNIPENNPAFTIESAKIEGDILILDVSYSGGCKDHDFTGYFNGTYIKTYPMKAKLFIVHQNNEDNCRALIKQTLRFNLKPMRFGDKGTLIILLNNTEQTFKYDY